MDFSESNTGISIVDVVKLSRSIELDSYIRHLFFQMWDKIFLISKISSLDTENSEIRHCHQLVNVTDNLPSIRRIDFNFVNRRIFLNSTIPGLAFSCANFPPFLSHDEPVLICTQAAWVFDKRSFVTLDDSQSFVIRRAWPASSLPPTPCNIYLTTLITPIQTFIVKPDDQVFHFKILNKDN